MKITIDTHYCLREELEELKEYLEQNCWDFTTDEQKEDSKFILLDFNRIYVEDLGAEVSLNEKIADEELHEYRIVKRKDLIDDLISWIGECGMQSSRASDKELMTQDLEMLMEWEDDYIFSSISTNSYLRQGDSEFDTTCEELIKLNKTLS